MVGTLLVAQVGWILLLLADLDDRLDVRRRRPAGPGRAGRPGASPRRWLGGTPWHGHHIAERYGLMVIIALGEGLLGTTAALGALIEDGWTIDIVVLGLAGVGADLRALVDLLRDPAAATCSPRLPRRAPSAGATATSRSSARSSRSAPGCTPRRTTSSDHSELSRHRHGARRVAVPLAVYVACLYLLYALLTRTIDPFHFLLIVLGRRSWPCRRWRWSGRRRHGLVPGRARAGAVGDGRRATRPSATGTTPRCSRGWRRSRPPDRAMRMTHLRRCGCLPRGADSQGWEAAWSTRS